MLADKLHHKLAGWLAKTRRALVLTHQRPDGDALAGAIGAVTLLRAAGATATIALFDPLPARYGPFFSDFTFVAWREVEGSLGEYDGVVIVDTCALGQLEPARAWLAGDPPPTLVIDHHVTGDALGRRADDLLITDASAAATGLLLAELIRGQDVPLDPPTATALFIGLATDTGWFRFPNADSRTFAAAGVLLDHGVAHDWVYRELFEQEPLPKLRLIGRLLSRLTVRCDGRLAIMELRQADLDAAGADASMTADLVNEAGRLADVEVFGLLTEAEPNLVRLNLRSKEQVDVATLAQQFGGGGHARAAGARIAGEWDVTREKVITALEQATRAQLDPAPECS